MIYEPFDIVVVPFPFTDSSRTKRRPALVLSQKSEFGAIIEHTVLAMITSQKNEPYNLRWPLTSLESVQTVKGRLHGCFLCMRFLRLGADSAFFRVFRQKSPVW